MPNHWMERLHYAIVDVETTGLNQNSELISVGLILARMDNLELVKRWDSKIRPHQIEHADADALKINGYNERAWVGAPPLREVMLALNALTRDATIVAYNAPFDVGFLARAFKLVNVANETSDGYICLLKLARLFIPCDEVENYKLKTICQYVGIPEEGAIHKASAGAEVAYNLFKLFRSKMPNLKHLSATPSADQG